MSAFYTSTPSADAIAASNSRPAEMPTICICTRVGVNSKRQTAYLIYVYVYFLPRFTLNQFHDAMQTILLGAAQTWILMSAINFLQTNRVPVTFEGLLSSVSASSPRDHEGISRMSFLILASSSLWSNSDRLPRSETRKVSTAASCSQRFAHSCSAPWERLRFQIDLNSRRLLITETRLRGWYLTDLSSSIIQTSKFASATKAARSFLLVISSWFHPFRYFSPIKGTEAGDVIGNDNLTHRDNRCSSFHALYLAAFHSRRSRNKQNKP